MRARLYGCSGHRASCGPELLRAPQGSSGALIAHPERGTHSSQTHLWSSCPGFPTGKRGSVALRRAVSPFTTGSRHDSCAAVPSALPWGTSQQSDEEQRLWHAGAPRLLPRLWPRVCVCPPVGRAAPHVSPTSAPCSSVPRIRASAQRGSPIPGSERRSPANIFIFIFLLSRPFCISILALRTGRNLLLVLHHGSSPTGSSQSVSAKAEPGRGAQQGRHRTALPNGTGWPRLPVLSDEGV